MRQLNESLTTFIGSMFENLHQFMEYKFQNLSEEINQLKARIDLYDLTTTTPHEVQGPSISSMNNIFTEIKDILQQGIDGITSEVKAQALRITKLEDCRRYEDEYATGLGILCTEFGRVHDSADNFTKL